MDRARAADVAPCPPGHADARFCLRAYFSELGRRFDDGFDPGLSISAADEEMTPPAGVLLVATLHGAPFNDEHYADHWFEKHLPGPRTLA